MEYLHFHSQGGGKGCQNWAIPSVPVPGLGSSTRRHAGGSASLPSIFLHVGHFIGSQLQPAVAHVLGPIIQRRKLKLRQRKGWAAGVQWAALNCAESRVPRSSHPASWEEERHPHLLVRVSARVRGYRLWRESGLIEMPGHTETQARILLPHHL